MLCSITRICVAVVERMRNHRTSDIACWIVPPIDYLHLNPVRRGLKMVECRMVDRGCSRAFDSRSHPARMDHRDVAGDANLLCGFAFAQPQAPTSLARHGGTRR